MHPIADVSLILFFAVWLCCCAYALETDWRDWTAPPDSADVASASARGD